MKGTGPLIKAAVGQLASTFTLTDIVEQIQRAVPQGGSRPCRSTVASYLHREVLYGLLRVVKKGGKCKLTIYARGPRFEELTAETRVRATPPPRQPKLSDLEQSWRAFRQETSVEREDS